MSPWMTLSTIWVCTTWVCITHFGNHWSRALFTTRWFMNWEESMILSPSNSWLSFCPMAILPLPHDIHYEMHLELKNTFVIYYDPAFCLFFLHSIFRKPEPKALHYFSTHNLWEKGDNHVPLRLTDQYLVNRNLDTSWLASPVLRAGPKEGHAQAWIPVPWVTENPHQLLQNIWNSPQVTLMRQPQG